MLELWLLIALIILIAVIYKPVTRTIFGALDGHAAKVRAELEQAKRLREEAQSLLASQQRQLLGGEDRARAIVEQARAEAERQIERHRSRARGQPAAAHRARHGADRPGGGARAAGGPPPAPRRSRSAPPSASCASSSTASRRRPCSTTRSRRSAASCPEGAGGRGGDAGSIKFPPVFGRNVSPFTLKLEFSSVRCLQDAPAIGRGPLIVFGEQP